MVIHIFMTFTAFSPQTAGKSNFYQRLLMMYSFQKYGVIERTSSFILIFQILKLLNIRGIKNPINICFKIQIYIVPLITLKILKKHLSYLLRFKDNTDCQFFLRRNAVVYETFSNGDIQYYVVWYLILKVSFALFNFFFGMYKLGQNILNL